MLYDIGADKEEKFDIKKRKKDINKKLKEEFENWESEMGRQSVPIWNDWPPKWDGELEESAK